MPLHVGGLEFACGFGAGSTSDGPAPARLLGPDETRENAPESIDRQFQAISPALRNHLDADAGILDVVGMQTTLKDRKLNASWLACPGLWYAIDQYARAIVRDRLGLRKIICSAGDAPV